MIWLVSLDILCASFEIKDIVFYWCYMEQSGGILINKVNELLVITETYIEG